MGIGTPSSTKRHDLIRHPFGMQHERQWATPEGVSVETFKSERVP